MNEVQIYIIMSAVIMSILVFAQWRVTLTDYKRIKWIVPSALSVAVFIFIIYELPIYMCSIHMDYTGFIFPR
jgi:hypothetical protein